MYSILLRIVYVYVCMGVLLGEYLYICVCYSNSIYVYGKVVM